MRLYYTAVVAASVAAYPSLDLPGLEARADTHPYMAPKAGWLRSPCPGTNTLANHGFINRNGKNITANAYLQGFFDAYNFGANISIPVLNKTFVLCQSRNNGKPCGSINLDILNLPHKIEHDGSMSRNDKKRIDNPNANNHSFNQTVWNMTLDIMGNVTHLTPQIQNTVRLRRVEQDQAADFPGWFIENIITSLSEHAFILMAFNDPKLNQPVYQTPQARLDWVNYWMVNERLPTNIGWVKPTSVLTQTGFGALIGVISTQHTIPASGVATQSASTTSATAASAPIITGSVASFNDAGATSTPAPMEKRATSTIAESQVASIARSPKGKSAISAAAAYATAQAGPQPVLPNNYAENLQGDGFVKLVEEVASFVIKREATFLKRLAALLGQ